MIQAVKDFIEYNIDLIEEKRWEDLFKNWYIYKKDYYTLDLMDVLEVVESNIWSVTQQIREHILYKVSVAILTNLAQKKKTITENDALNEFEGSFLGLSYDEIVPILDRAARNVGLAKSTNGWYRV